MSEWISVKDRLPENLKVVLVSCEIAETHEKDSQRYKEVALGYFEIFEDNAFRCAVACSENEQQYLRRYIATSWWENPECVVTHWMPLPEPPEVIPDD